MKINYMDWCSDFVDSIDGIPEAVEVLVSMPNLYSKLDAASTRHLVNVVNDIRGDMKVSCDDIAEFIGILMSFRSKESRIERIVSAWEIHVRSYY